MKKIKKREQRVIGFVNGKRIKTSISRWKSIMSDPKNKVVFKEGDNDEEE